MWNHGGVLLGLSKDAQVVKVGSSSCIVVEAVLSGDTVVSRNGVGVQ